jgi:hypothetical protein
MHLNGRPSKPRSNPPFGQVLDAYFDGGPDQATDRLLQLGG